MRSTKVTIDGVEFVVPALNIGQLERVADIIRTQKDSANGGFNILRVGLERATPKPDYETLAPEIDEIGVVVRAILKMSGLQKPDENPPLTVVGGTQSL